MSEEGQAQGTLHSEVQCIMGNGNMGPPPTEQSDRQTPVKILTFHNFVGGRFLPSYLKERSPSFIYDDVLADPKLAS